jgi:hypothetical protein
MVLSHAARWICRERNAKKASIAEWTVSVIMASSLSISYE